MKVSTTGAAIFLMNSMLLAGVTQPLALTLQGFLIVGFGLFFNVAGYLIGRRDGRNE